MQEGKMCASYEITGDRTIESSLKSINKFLLSRFTQIHSVTITLTSVSRFPVSLFSVPFLHTLVFKNCGAELDEFFGSLGITGDSYVKVIKFVGCGMVKGYTFDVIKRTVSIHTIVLEDCSEFNPWPRGTADGDVPELYKRFSHLNSIRKFVIKGTTSVVGENFVSRILLTWKNLECIDFSTCRSKTGTRGYTTDVTICDIDCKELIAYHGNIKQVALPSGFGIQDSQLMVHSVGTRIQYIVTRDS